ncbi:hypothetical protein KHQ06_08125 [Nocardia tengchongensis]|uniref:Uncharacterized protein n=1 Tax=Nocardia tengchongensis TaxID=2055889 RepID=A0ABX8CTP9_9NOCA|nr:hypothetical protein [Nocardia tengchongensis]QVI22919.1 hypothetical protein KHQ06_08125 [Nocardia tengchongensis]
MRARTALIAFIAMTLIYALVRHPEVVLVPAFVIGLYMLVRPRHGWLRGRR